MDADVMVGKKAVVAGGDRKWVEEKVAVNLRRFGINVTHHVGNDVEPHSIAVPTDTEMLVVLAKVAGDKLESALRNRLMFFNGVQYVRTRPDWDGMRADLANYGILPIETAANDETAPAAKPAPATVMMIGGHSTRITKFRNILTREYGVKNVKHVGNNKTSSDVFTIGNSTDLVIICRDSIGHGQDASAEGQAKSLNIPCISIACKQADTLHTAMARAGYARITTSKQKNAAPTPPPKIEPVQVIDIKREQLVSSARELMLQNNQITAKEISAYLMQFYGVALNESDYTELRKQLGIKRTIGRPQGAKNKSKRMPTEADEEAQEAQEVAPVGFEAHMLDDDDEQPMADPASTNEPVEVTQEPVVEEEKAQEAETIPAEPLIAPAATVPRSPQETLAANVANTLLEIGYKIASGGEFYEFSVADDGPDPTVTLNHPTVTAKLRMSQLESLAAAMQRVVQIPR